MTGARPTQERGCSVRLVDAERSNLDDLCAQIVSLLADMHGDDLFVLYLTGHGVCTGVAGEPPGTLQFDIPSEDFVIPTKLWEYAIGENAQPGTAVATIDMGRLSRQLVQHGVTVGNLNAGSPGSDTTSGPTCIAIPSLPQSQQTDGSTFEIQLPETPEYYSDSIEMLSIALDSISEIVPAVRS